MKCYYSKTEKQEYSLNELFFVIFGMVKQSVGGLKILKTPLYFFYFSFVTPGLESDWVTEGTDGSAERHGGYAAVYAGG